jgi:Flp pilus assembly protein TadG
MPVLSGTGATERLASRRQGSAMIEFCLLIPWYIFLFIGTFDFGFYAYSLNATETAARVAGNYCSASSGTCASHDATACTNYVTSQLSNMPNMSGVTVCTASPLILTVTYPAAATCPDGNTCTTVSVAYTTPNLIPIPGVLTGQITITRSVTLRLSS